MSFTLRDYQQAAVKAAFLEWRKVRSTLGVAATGLGKTVMADAIIHKFLPMPTMFVAHRGELITQALRTFESSGLRCGVEKADSKADGTLFGRYDVVLATVQTLNTKIKDGSRRMGKFDFQHFGLLICDEAHHSVASQWKNVVHYFSQNPDLRVFGITATPDRLDEEALKQIFDSVAFNYDIMYGVDNGWLVPIDQQRVTIEGLDFSHVKTQAGDLNGAQLAKVMEIEQNLHGVAGATMQIAGDKKRTIVFTVSVKQAEILSDILNRHRAGCASWVCGATPDEKRKDIFTRFQSGETQILCNVLVASEGFDCPQAEVIVMARPTKSRALYTQMAGRGTRPLPGTVDGILTPAERLTAIAQSDKPSMCIVDLAGNSGKHKLVTALDILGGKVSDQIIERALKRMAKLGKRARIAEIIEEEKRLTDKEREEARAREAARKAKLTANVSIKTRRVNPFTVFDIRPNDQRELIPKDPPSEAQLQFLLKVGVDPSRLTRQTASIAIGKIKRSFALGGCSPKQAEVLQRYGFPYQDVTRKQASQWLDMLAANNWRLPAGWDMARDTKDYGRIPNPKDSHEKEYH